MCKSIHLLNRWLLRPVSHAFRASLACQQEQAYDSHRLFTPGSQSKRWCGSSEAHVGLETAGTLKPRALRSIRLPRSLPRWLTTPEELISQAQALEGEALQLEIEQRSVAAQIILQQAKRLRVLHEARMLQPQPGEHLHNAM